MDDEQDGSRPVLAVPPGDKPLPDCDHAAARELANDGGTRYLQCQDCSAVLVVAGAPPTGDVGDDSLGSIDSRLDDLLEDIEAYHDGRPSSFGPGQSPSLRDRLAALLRRRD